MTTVPEMSTSSMARRIASVAAWSAPSLSPRPMYRAEAIAAASVTRMSSRARRPSIDRYAAASLEVTSPAPRSVAEVAPAREDHGHMVLVGGLDGHLVTCRSARLDDRGHARLRGELDPVRERAVGVAGHDAQAGPIGRAAQRDLDGHRPIRLAGADAHGGTVAREHD